MQTNLAYKQISIFGKQLPDASQAKIEWDCELINYKSYSEIVIKIRKITIYFEDGHELHCLDSDCINIQTNQKTIYSPTSLIVDFNNSEQFKMEVFFEEGESNV